MDTMLSKALREFMTGSLKQLIVNLGGEDGEQWEEELKRFNRKEPCWVKSASAILDFVCEVLVSASKKFLAKEHFTKNNKDGVKFYGFGSNFEANFLDKEEAPQSERKLRCHKLKKNSPDKPILEELGDKAETTLSDIWELLKEQPNGKPGKLLTNSYANIFYVRDARGILWAVDVGWYGDGWGVGARSVTYPDEWGVGYRVFSRSLR